MEKDIGGPIVRLGDVVGKFGAASTGLLVLAYIIGDRYIYSYYTQAGAVWIRDVYSYPDIIKASSFMMLIVLIAFFHFYSAIASSDYEVSGVNKFCIYIGLLGGIGAVIVIFEEFIPAEALSYFAYFSALFLLASTGGRVAAMVYDIGFHQKSLSPVHLSAIWLIFIMAFMQAPGLVAKYDFSHNFGSKFKYLAVVYLTDGTCWNLVKQLGDKSILVKTEGEDFVYRVVAHESIVKVKSVLSIKS